MKKHLLRHLLTLRSSGCCMPVAVQFSTKTFEEIPSPTSIDLPFIGHAFEVLKKPAGLEQMWKNIITMKQKYAPDSPMLRTHLPLSNQSEPGMVLWLFDPHLIQTMFQNEGKYPYRGQVLEALEFMRNRRPDVFGENLGVLMDEGEKWHAFRSSVQQDMLRPKSAHYYIDKLEGISNDFTNYIKSNRDEEDVIENFVKESRRFSFESISLVALDERIGALPTKNITLKDSEKVLLAMETANNVLGKMVFGVPTWKIYPDPRWNRSFKKAEDAFWEILDIIKEKVNKSVSRLEQESEESIKSRNISMLEKFIMKKGSQSPIPMVMAFDMMVAGIDTTSNTLAFMAYLLSRNLDKQEMIRKEIKSVIKDGQPITSQSLAKIKILRATVKETLRLYPIVSLNMRVLPADTVIGGHNIPKGTLVAYSLYYNKGLFSDPEEFKPERWLRENSKEIHPFTSLPFSHGSRSCIGRRFAELELQLALVGLLRSFRIEWAGDPDAKVEGIQQVVIAPNMPLKIRFSDLKM